MHSTLTSKVISGLLSVAIALAGIVPSAGACFDRHKECERKQCCCGCCGSSDAESDSCCSAKKVKRTCHCAVKPETPALPSERPSLPERHELSGISMASVSAVVPCHSTGASRMREAESPVFTPYLPQACVLCRWLA